MSHADVVKKTRDRKPGTSKAQMLNSTHGRIDAIRVLDGVPYPVLAMDREYRVLRVNQAFAKLLNLIPEQCEGKTCYELLKSSHCQTNHCACSRAMDQNQPVTAEATIHPNGNALSVRYRATPLTDSSGAVVGAVEIVEDMSHEIAERAKLGRSMQALRKLPTPVMAITRDFTVLEMNDVGAHTVGLRVDECVGRKCYDLFKTEHCHTERCACQQAMTKADIITEETVARPKGRQLPIRYTGAPLRDSDGAVIGAVEFVLDISQEMEKRAHNREVTDVLFRMKENDLSARVVGRYSEELEKVSQAVDGGLDAINEMLHDVVNSVQQVAATSGEVSTASQKLAEGAQEQAAAVEEISASLRKTDDQIKANAENATLANQLVTTMNNTAKMGREEMDRMLAAMGDISEAAGSISKIMKVIDDIAFQTNILALNAAVEAARAGKYGRGFAVVAQEVRNLAGRSAKAAQQSAELIGASNKKVTHGVAIAEKTAKALEEIVGGVTKVKDLVAEIAVASREQATNVSQVSVGMDQISSAVSAVSAQSEETAAASEELSSIAESLKSQIAAFKLSERKAQQVEAPLALPAGITPQLVQQLLAMLAGQRAVTNGVPHLERAQGTVTKEPTPAEVLPLDTDSRGYGNF